MSNIFNSTVTPGLLALSEDRDTIDYLKDVRTQLRETMREKYEPNKLNQQSEFNAICLRQLSNTTVENKEVVRIIARVPELHNLIPIPQSEDDFLAISLYPTYVGQAEDLAGSPSIPDNTILPGTRLVVKYENLTNFTDPKIVRITNIMDGQGGRFSDAPAGSGRRTGQRRSTPTTPGTIQDYTKNIKISTGDTARYGDNKPYKYFLQRSGGDPRKPYPLRENQLRYVGFRRFGTRSPWGVVLHQGSVAKAGGTVDALQGRGSGYGSHYEVRPDGTILEYEDPKYKLIHAGRFNTKFIGIDLGGWTEPREGKGGSRPLKQLEATWVLINKLAKEYGFPVKMIWSRNPGAASVYSIDISRRAQSRPQDFKGIHAHEEIGDHADGNFAKIYMAHRIFGKSAEVSLEKTKEIWTMETLRQKTDPVEVTGVPNTNARTGLSWPAGAPKRVIPIGIIKRHPNAVRQFGAGPDIVEMNNYTGKAYTLAQLEAAIAAEGSSQPALSPFDPPR
jgi:hypothetical protein